MSGGGFQPNGSARCCTLRAVSKQSPAAVLAVAIRAVATGGMYADPAATAQVMDSLTRLATQDDRSKITDREAEVCRMTGASLAGTSAASTSCVPTTT